MERGVVVGKTKNKYITIANNNKPYLQSEYVILEDINQGNLIAEVIDTTIIPFVESELLPDGVTETVLKKINFNENNPVYLAKIKVLEDTSYPIMPTTIVRSCKYEEISHLVSKKNPKEAMVIGVIKGTEDSNQDLPSELNNIAPMWINGQAEKQEGIPFLLDQNSFREYPHIGLFGSSGSGKSFALRVLCEEFMKLKIPGIAFDPHYELKFTGKMNNISASVDNEFLIDYQSRYNEFIIGENVGIHFEDLNSTELKGLFDFVDPLTEPQKNALDLLHEKGNSFLNLKNKIIALKEAFEIKEKSNRGQKIEEEFTPLQLDLYTKMKSQISGSLTLQALSWKCTALEKTNIFVSDIKEVKKTMKERKFAIIRGDIRRLQMISSYLLNKLYKARRDYIDKDKAYFPPFMAILDEIHNFAPEGNGSSPTKSILRKIGQEARKYGLFLVGCTQRPRNLDNTLLAQLNTKFIFRLTDSTDMNVAKVEGNLTEEEVSRLPDLTSGNCFVSSATLNKSYSVKFRTTFSKAPNVKNPFEELNEELSEVTDELDNILIEMLPLTGVTIARNLPEINEVYGKISMKDVLNRLEEMVSCGLILKNKDFVGVKYIKK